MSSPRPTSRPTEVPALSGENDGVDSATEVQCAPEVDARRRPFLIGVAGQVFGKSFELKGTEITLGRASEMTIPLLDDGVSRNHARVRDDGEQRIIVEDLGSSNGTYLNGERITTAMALNDGDKLRLGANVVFKFSLLDELDERYQTFVDEAVTSTGRHATFQQRNWPEWTPDTWRTKPMAQAIVYEEEAAVEAAVAKLSRLPPLVSSWEIEELKTLIAEAQEGRRFLLQGGDCAETLADCEPTVLINKLKILIQMSLVLIRGARRPIIRVGRFAGQYAKPRSRPTETRDGVELPSYFGDMVNRPAFDAASRKPDADLLVQCYLHASATLNFVRSMSGGGFSDLRRPEYFDLQFFERADLPSQMREEYARMCQEITQSLHFLEAVGDRGSDDLMRVAFYSSHEALSLRYEAAQTRKVPHREGYYDLTTHLPWIGERTRALGSAHVEFFRGIQNPVGVKLGPTTVPAELVELCQTLNPQNSPGKLVLITRMGVKNAAVVLPKVIEAIEREKLRVLWVCDPMHGNATTLRSGVKTRNFDDILKEVLDTMAVHRGAGTYLGGVHFEMTGEDVTECVGGGLTEEDLDRNYVTACDPRLNYRQAVEMAFCIARDLKTHGAPPPSAQPAGPPSRRR